MDPITYWLVIWTGNKLIGKAGVVQESLLNNLWFICIAEISDIFFLLLSFLAVTVTLMNCAALVAPLHILDEQH